MLSKRLLSNFTIEVIKPKKEIFPSSSFSTSSFLQRSSAVLQLLYLQETTPPFEFAEWNGLMADSFGNRLLFINFSHPLITHRLNTSTKLSNSRSKQTDFLLTSIQIFIPSPTRCVQRFANYYMTTCQRFHTHQMSRVLKHRSAFLSTILHFC